MLTERQRRTLLWCTVGLILLVVVTAAAAILLAWRSPSAVREIISIMPEEADLCPGERQRFVVEGIDQAAWTATGGTIGEDGIYTAGDVPGDYAVVVENTSTFRSAEAAVQILVCTPPASPVAPPLPSPHPTTALGLTPTLAIAEPAQDPQGDVAAYEGGPSIGEAPASVDIRAASLAPDLSVDLSGASEAPDGLSGWVTEKETLLWILLYAEVLDPPAAYTEYLVALDIDGDTTTGRPPDTARVNPDLGDEAVLGISFDPATNEYVPYLLVWDPAIQDWQAVPDLVRYTFDESRTRIGLALRWEAFLQTVVDTAGVSARPASIRGRAAALTYVDEQAVIDFYPDRPE